MISPGAIPQVADLQGGAAHTESLLIRHGRSRDLVPGEVTSDPELHPEGHEQAAAPARS